MQDAGRWTASPTLFMCKVASSFLEGPPANIGRLLRSLACADAHPYPSMPCALFLAGLCSRPSSSISFFWCTPPGVWCSVCVMLVQTWLLLLVHCKYRLGIGEISRCTPIWHRCTKSALSCKRVPSFSPYGIYILSTRGVPGEYKSHPPSAAIRQLGVTCTYNWGPILRALLDNGPKSEN
jgi:hypothetical protein